MPELPDILICRCSPGGPHPAARVRALTSILRAAGTSFAEVPDLCELAARRDPSLAAWARRPGLRIVACFPRAVNGLLDAAGLKPPADLAVINLRDVPADEAARALGVEPPPADSTPSESSATEVTAAGAEGGGWFPWFPVIDRARCTSCRQCVDFCLFGVYTFEDGRVEVRNPSGCKPHCPACARICPSAAIMFPKHDEAPVDGSPVTDEAAEKARIQRDLHALLGDDLDAALAERRRRALARRLVDPARLRSALEERARHAAAKGGAS